MAHSRDCTCSYCAYLVHYGHETRELYEFNIDQPCPCASCADERNLKRMGVWCTVLVLVAVLLLKCCVQ